MRIAVLTTRADIPGTNAAIRMLVAVGVARRHEMLGVSGGFDGLLAGQIEPLALSDVDGITRQAGSLLGGSGTLVLYDDELRGRACAILAEHAVEALVVIGGSGTIEGCRRMAEQADCGVIVVPASLENDIGLTKACIGADSVARRVIGPAGSPTQTDRVLAIRLGFEGVVAAEQRATGVMLGWDVDDGSGQPTEDTRVQRVSLEAVVSSRPSGAIDVRMAG